MRISIMFGSDALGILRPPDQVAADAVTAEKEGFASAWCTHITRGIDSLTTLAVAARATSRIELGVGVVPSYPRHPMALAQSAATVQALAGGRFVLGVGVSHRPVIEGMHGLDYSSQIGHLREYLTVLNGLLTNGSVSFEGEHYRVHGEFTIPGTSAVPVIVGALAERMCRLGGEMADGVTTWLAGPKSLEEVVVPAVTDGAEEAGKPPPRVLAGIPVAVDPDRNRAHEATARVFGRYGMLVNYRRLFEREGVDGPVGLAITGNASTVTARIQDLFDAGATDVWAVPFDTGCGTDSTRRLLLDLATG
ncbi:MAG: TIGR03564 family F420-dependent LLM class oxidoreductase [bacterium]|nr:TIGR03564 family F420-dependent LLM class oxidoreductase [bacterium]MDE0290292.1 TIGR03564 family F420-dependent LLM class oxidoreductase [bacterium]MDE0440330.1 TIGR03564 family F420-dependent LLM class oxidoreductase [bacterium]